MLREADLALRVAKAQGKDRVVASPELVRPAPATARSLPAVASERTPTRAG
jgi:hypothetical protein